MRSSFLARSGRVAVELISLAADRGASLKDLDEGLRARADEPDRAILRRVLDAYAAATRDRGQAAPPYLLGWQYADAGPSFMEERYLRALRGGDVDELEACLSGVLRHMPLEGLLEYARYPDLVSRAGNSPIERTRVALRRRRFVNSVRHDLRCWSARVSAPIDQLRPSEVGSPWGVVVDSILVTGAAPRHDYYADQIARLVDGVSRPRIAEIGGGFGGFAYYLLRRCPEACYVDFDLPEVVALASYYLLSAFPDRSAVLYGEAVLDERTLATSDLVLMPNFALADLPARSVDLFLNTASLSEMHQPTIEQYIADIGRSCRRFFFHDNSDHRVPVGVTHEVPAASFPAPEGFRLIREQQSPWFSSGRYRERLLERV